MTRLSGSRRSSAPPEDRGMGRLAALVIVSILAAVGGRPPRKPAPRSTPAVGAVASGTIVALYERGDTRIVTLADGSEWLAEDLARRPRVGAPAEVYRAESGHRLVTEAHAIPVRRPRWDEAN